jgi:poly-gamma-glutamate capsule biosynthesis protein CapA/YwtB (metallophosphatase superfamily)
VAIVLVGCAFAGVGGGAAIAGEPGTSPASASASADRLHVPPRTFTIAATGDIITENAVNAAAATPGPSAAGRIPQRYDFAPLFGPVTPILQSVDLAICHMELPIGRPGEREGIYGRSPYGGNLLLAPYELASGLRDAGFDRCSTASNHSNDLGAPSIDSTLAALDGAGLTHTGTARTAAESAVALVRVNGVEVAHLSYTRYSNTNPTVEHWQLQFAADPAQVAADAAAARRAGAEVVIVSLHLSQEMLAAPTAEDRAFVTQLTAAARIDLVVQHGPHVIQPVELVNDTWVYWSVGNFISGMGWARTGRYADPRTMDGLMAIVRFTELPSGRFTASPATVLLCNERVSRTVYPVFSALTDPRTAPALRDQLEQCAARSAAIVPTAR